ncbi:MAG TPA: DUF2141 domain-containing protein [Candidatus Merdimorpha stercoravium]|uniref:DUF2141 domain-containing protein n=1 Tax=Candidatus Merdimorpha stercoravium TaxID=2840863 RepID=A0A9D1H9Y6_9FLAO|nr:DUF2141 domain-containing protein [Candidatus Merdimorpha stercoravium]
MANLVKPFLLTALLALSGASYGQSLEIVLTQTEDEPGSLILTAIADSTGQMIRYDITAAQMDTTRILLEGLPKGRVKIYTFQDCNGNYHLDTDAEGTPTERCADARTELLSGKNTVQIPLRTIPRKKQE